VSFPISIALRRRGRRRSGGFLVLSGLDAETIYSYPI